MTVLSNSDFEGSTGTVAAPTGMPGWTNDFSTWLIGDASTWGGTAVNGTRVCGRDAVGDNGYYTTSGKIADQAVRHAYKWATHTTPPVVGHLLRRDTNSSYYYTTVDTDGTSLRCSIYRYSSGSTLLNQSAYVLACSVGDVIHHESKIIGSSIESRIWKNSESRPATATASATSSSIASGYPGLIRRGGAGWAFADQVVVTDGAGGEDFYYTTAPTLTSPTGTQTGSTTASGTVSTDEANGTLYFLASTNATETAATVKAASSQTVTATGTQSVSFTGLTASTTYYAHYCHTDAAANDSTVANSASFTTAAANTYRPNINKPRSGMGVNFYGAR